MTGWIKSLLKPKTPTIVAPTPDPTPVPTPEPTPAAVMPTEQDSVEVARAKTNEIRRRMQRGGRASTIMSQANSGNAGSDTYSSKTLG